MVPACVLYGQVPTNTGLIPIPNVTIQGLLYAKEMTFEGKDGSTSVLRYLTNGSVWTDVVNDVRWTRAGNIKGQPLMAAMEAGVEDTGSDGYQ